MITNEDTVAAEVFWYVISLSSNIHKKPTSCGHTFYNVKRFFRKSEILYEWMYSLMSRKRDQYNSISPLPFTYRLTKTLSIIAMLWLSPWLMTMEVKESCPVISSLMGLLIKDHPVPILDVEMIGSVSTVGNR